MYSAYFQYSYSEVSVSQINSPGSGAQNVVTPILNQVPNIGGNGSSGIQSAQNPTFLTPLQFRDESQSFVSNMNNSRPVPIQTAERYNRISIASLLNEQNNESFSPPDSPYVINRHAQEGQNQADSASLPPVPNSIGGASNALSRNRRKIENNGRRHTCHTCGQGFHQKAGLKQHIKAVHRRIKDHACDEPGCEKAYSTVGDLTRHRRSVHLGHRPFACICKRRYSKRASLTRHINVTNCGPQVEPKPLQTSSR